MGYNPEETFAYIGDQVISPMSNVEVTGIELDQEEFIDTTFTLNGEDYHIKMKRGDLDYIIDKHCKGRNNDEDV